jgi:hypothetical protein
MTSLYASEIGIQFSKRKHDVKAFLFVQINRDVARCVSETRAATLSTRIRMTRNCAGQSMAYAILMPLSSAMAGHRKTPLEPTNRVLPNQS